MNDQTIMENLLHTTKGVCDLYMHGTIESSTPTVHRAFDAALSDNLCMQEDIYKNMTDKGWYETTPADAAQVAKVKQKYTMQ